MVTRFQPLREFAPRTLSMLASIVHGAPCDVQLTRDIKAKANVVCRNHQLFFDPDRSNLGHLLVAASLLRHRGQIEAESGKVDRMQLQRWLDQDVRELLRRFPAIPRCGGALPRSGYRVSWDQVQVRPRQPEDHGKGMRHVLLGRQLDVRGGGDPLQALLVAAEKGYLTEHPMPDFPELAVVRETVRAMPVVATDADKKTLQEWYALMPEIVQDGARCYRDSAQTIRQEIGLPQVVGNSNLLDPVHLHDCYVASRLGLDLPPMSLEPDVEPVRQFDPEKFVVVFAFDLAGLPNYGVMQPSPSEGILTAFLRVLQTLGAAVKVVGYWDHVVERPGKPALYVSSETVVKDFDEPLDDSAALRCLHALRFEQRESARSACFPPFHFERIRTHLREEVQRRGECQCQVYYFGSRPVPQAQVERRHMDARVASFVDATMAGVEQWVGDECGGMALFSMETAAARAPKGWIERTRWKAW